MCIDKAKANDFVLRRPSDGALLAHSPDLEIVMYSYRMARELGWEPVLYAPDGSVVPVIAPDGDDACDVGACPTCAGTGVTCREACGS